MEPFPALSEHNSSNASGCLQYLDATTPHSPGAGASTASSAVSPPPAPQSPASSGGGRSPSTAAFAATAKEPFELPRPAAPPQHAPPWAWSRVWGRVTERTRAVIDQLLVGNNVPEQDAAKEPQVAVQIVHIDAPKEEKVDDFLSMTNGGAFDVDDEEDEESADGAFGDSEQLRFEIDLKSALRGYCKSPSECFKHLVGAALLSRSAENPVTGDELREAQRHPYLLRMIAESGALDVSDPVAQEEVSRCVDEILSNDPRRVPQRVYECLLPLLRFSFIRLTREQYMLMKSSGFEFIQLLCKYPHILPNENIKLTTANHGCIMRNVDLILMVLSALMSIFCLMSIGLIIVFWMTVGHGKYTRYGFYTITAYGVGFALHFLSVLFLMRGKERDVVYGEMLTLFPSSNLHVVPVIPLFDIACIFTYIRYYASSSASERYVAVMHDIVAAQTLSFLAFVFCIAMPQLIAQTYMTLDGLLIPSGIERGFEYTLLNISTILSWLLALMRLVKVFAMSDSISCFGFACFGFHYDRIIERYSEIPRSLYASSLFVLELNLFFIISGSLTTGCLDPVTLTLASMSTLILIVVFYLLLLSHETVFRILWSTIPLCIVQVVLSIYHKKYSPKDGCVLQYALKSDVLPFRFSIWAVYFFLILALIIQIFLLKAKKLAKKWGLRQ